MENNCYCNTYNESPTQFLDIEGVRYLMSLLDRVVKTKSDINLKTIKNYVDTKLAEGGSGVSASDLATDADIDSLF